MQPFPIVAEHVAQRIAGAVEADHEAVADEQVVPDTLDRDDVLDPRLRVGRRRQRPAEIVEAFYDRRRIARTFEDYIGAGALWQARGQRAPRLLSRKIES